MNDLPSLSRFGIECVAVDGGGFELRGADRDWLRAVFVAFGRSARVEGSALRVAGTAADIERDVRAALRPGAALFDLDGVLADIARRRRIADPEDLARVASGRPVGVVTTCPRRLAISVLERHGFAEHVGVVVGSDDGPCKPDPFPVRFALQELGHDAAWMLGDNPSDVTAARGGGAVPFAIEPRGIGAQSHADRLRAAGAVRLVPDVAAFADLLPPRD